MISDAINRLMYGPVVEEGEFDEHRSDYESLVKNLDSVDVEVYEWFDPVPESRSFLNSSRMKSGEASAYDLDGEEAWDFAENALESMMPTEDSIDEVPFYFEHRSRGNSHKLDMGASLHFSLAEYGEPSLGSRRDYLISFNGSE